MFCIIQPLQWNVNKGMLHVKNMRATSPVNGPRPKEENAAKGC